MEGDNKAIRRTEFESRREWEKSPFLINAQIRRSLCLKIVQTMETPTEATEKGGKQKQKKRIDWPVSSDRQLYRYSPSSESESKSESESDPAHSITVFKRDSLRPCVQSFIINNKPETKDSPTHTHSDTAQRQRKVMAKQLLHMDIQYLLRIRRVWRCSLLQSRQPKSMRENIHFICTPKYVYIFIYRKSRRGCRGRERQSIYDKQIPFTFPLSRLEM